MELVKTLPSPARQMDRIDHAGKLFPVSAIVRVAGESKLGEIINYHYQGACIKFDGTDLAPKLGEQIEFDFFLGRKEVKSNVPARVAWVEKDNNSVSMGLEYLSDSKQFVERGERLIVNKGFIPTIVAEDPLNPGRTILFKVEDTSITGMSVSTSLSNKHIFPGMVIKNCEITFPGQKPFKQDLSIINARKHNQKGSFLLGVSITSDRTKYRDALRTYHSTFSAKVNSDIFDTTSPQKKIKNALTFKVVSSLKDYQKILKLRYHGYKHHKKVNAKSSWKDQGKGLATEGVLIAASLAGKLIGSLSIRFSSQDDNMIILPKLGHKRDKLLKSKSIIEIHKLVVDPKFQGSDVVIGMFQKAHVCALNHGGGDVLVSVTDKLKPFYEKIGFEELGVKIPHPSLKKMDLELMVLSEQAYQGDLKLLNPNSWTNVYQASHAYFENIGLTSPTEMKEKRTHYNQFSSTIDPKWTGAEMNVSVILPYILQAESSIGAKNVTKILDDIGIPKSYFLQTSNWTTLDFLDEFLDRYSEFGCIEELSYQAGRRSLKKDILGFNYYLLKHFATPKKVLSSFATSARRFNKTRTYFVEKLNGESATVKVGVQSYRLPKHSAACQNWIGNFEAFLKLLTGQDGIVTKTKCCYQGDTHCVYKLSWQSETSKTRIILASLTAAASLGLAYAFFGAQTFTTFSVLMFGTFISFVLVKKWVGLVQANKNLNQAFENLEKNSNQKYEELHQAKSKADYRFKEGKLLNQISVEIQRKGDLKSKLQTSIDSLCNIFGFSRAIIMLADDKKQLRTSAIAGVSQHQDLLWKFTIDASTFREDSPLVVSTAYQKGVSILLPSIQKHMFQLNDASKAIIQKLNIEGFLVVPIPAQNQNWGVVIAEDKSKLLSHQDLILVQRLALQLGIALDIHSQLENEVHLRKFFQKYVPSEVVQDALRKQQPRLGGTKQDMLCMFLDVRGFTAISNKLPPEIVLNWLNQFFTVTEGCIKSSGGYIDKFLGDGFMALWADNDERSCDAVVNCAFNILEKLKNLNIQFAKDSYPNIEIGIGIHLGPVIVGNLGSKDRMEYTAIGNNINFASRLESLAKTFASDVVISSAVLQKLTLPLASKFQTKENVSIRGVEEEQKIGIYTHKVVSAHKNYKDVS